MPSNVSAGLLMCRFNDNQLQFFLVHPGGPFFQNKNKGVWSIPKGIPEEGEDLFVTAQREFREETGLHPAPPFHPLGQIKQKSGKIVHAWAFIGGWNPQDGTTSNYFEIEWPPRSGKRQRFPEQDKAEWMTLEKAKVYINPQQAPFLERALEIFDGKTDN